MNEWPSLEYSLKNGQTKEVRHLILVPLNSSAETELVQLTNGVESIRAAGTKFEMRAQADTLAQTWVNDEGFRRPNKGSLVYEPLEPTVALALKLGYTSILVNLQTVTLTTWPGMKAKNGGHYVYAIDRTKLHAEPMPAIQPAVPKDPKEAMAFLLEYNRALESTFGPREAFALGPPRLF
jgi:hypothetical protein